MPDVPHLEPTVESRWRREAETRLGTTLKDKYRLTSILGLGGMATVYRGSHRNGLEVAVKVMHREVCRDGEAKERFLREGYAANSVGHPGVVRVLDDDITDDGAAYLVMELLEGSILDDDVVLGGKISPKRFLGLIAQLLDILTAAHGVGIVHRDIKPENLFLTRAGELKILDFGIARLATPGGRMTQSGEVFGTPAFLPPEQALGKTELIDGRTDLWSVGATMFTLLSGRLVHEADTGQEQMVMAAIKRAPAFGPLCPEMPKSVAAIVDRALQYKKEDRFATARDMRRALDQAVAEGGIPTQLSQQPRSPRGKSGGMTSFAVQTGPRFAEVGKKGVVIGGIVGLVMGGAALGAWALYGRKPPVQTTAAASAPALPPPPPTAAPAASSAEPAPAASSAPPPAATSARAKVPPPPGPAPKRPACKPSDPLCRY